MSVFDPNEAAQHDTLFGLPFTPDDAALVVVPCPWDATSSRRGGAVAAPALIREASMYVELYDQDFGDAVYTEGIALAEAPADLPQLQEDAAQSIALARETVDSAALRKANILCEQADAAIECAVQQWHERKKCVAVLGGDHSTALGCIRACAKRHAGMGILQIDAHADLRPAFEGMHSSHGSLMHNVLQRNEIAALVPVGIRGCCEREALTMQRDARITPFTDRSLAARLARGEIWQDICDDIVGSLPDAVYISLDVDGLDPALFPRSGTPVPGGLSFRDIAVLLQRLSAARKRIVGFDLTEIAPQAWHDADACNGAHLLYMLAGFSLRSRRTT